MDRHRQCNRCKAKYGDDYPGPRCIHCGGKVKAPASREGQHRIATRGKAVDRG